MHNSNVIVEVSIEQLRKDWVDSNKIPEDVFDFCCKATNSHSAYTTWLVKRVSEDNYLRDNVVDLYRDAASSLDKDQIVNSLRRSFAFYIKYSKLFRYQDINRYKKYSDWMDELQVINKQVEDKDSQQDESRLLIGKVKAANGTEYDVYKLPQGHEENRQIAIKLGRHKPGVSGWCTSHDSTTTFWNNHICREDLYIFINPNNRLVDKFQIQFGYGDSLPYNINDKPVKNFSTLIDYLPFYKFLHDKEGREYPKWYGKVAGIKVNFKEPDNLEESLQVTQTVPGVYRFRDFSLAHIDTWYCAFRHVLGLDKSEELRTEYKGEVVDNLFIRSRSGVLPSINVLVVPLEENCTVRLMLDTEIKTIFISDFNYEDKLGIQEILKNSVDEGSLVSIRYLNQSEVLNLKEKLDAFCTKYGFRCSPFLDNYLRDSIGNARREIRESKELAKVLWKDVIDQSI